MTKSQNAEDVTVSTMVNDVNPLLSYGSIIVKEQRSSSTAMKYDSEHPIFVPYHDGENGYDSSTSIEVLSHSSTFDLNSRVTRSEGVGNATIASTVASITKNLVGAGVLSLSGGIAIFSNSPRAIYVAIVWIVLLGAMFGFFCLLIAKAGATTGCKNLSYREIWEKTMGQQGGLAVSLVSTLLPAQGNLSYATVLSYTLKSLLEAFHVHWSRVSCLLFLTVSVLLPLCMMKNIDALSPFSTIGVASIGVVMISMIIRCVDGTYRPGGKYYADIVDFHPSFGKENEMWTIKVLPFVCMVFQSYVMHYNAPRFYTELRDASVSRFTKTVGFSFGTASMMYISIAAAGFLTFGGNSSSYILNNYSPKDYLANVSRVGVFFSTLLIYPLAFIGVRDGLLDVFQLPPEWQTPRNMNIFTISVLSILTIFSILFNDLGLINAVGGGALATLLCFVFPALMYRQVITNAATKCPGEIQESCLALFLMVIGVFLGSVGVYQSIIEATSSKAN
jgi:amino acid permease